MATRDCLLAIDQGTTSSRAMLFSPDGTVLHTSQEEFEQHYPQEGWVEHDPDAIWTTTLRCVRAAVQRADAVAHMIAAIGITNQRETVIVWDRQTGEAIYPAIVWQDRRTAGTCATLEEEGHAPLVSTRTGLLIDPYFSATKIAWILDHVDGARTRAERGDLACGTIDTFLLWRLTAGKIHATDATNASRTSLFDIHTNEWDDDLLALFRVPKALLPYVYDTAADYGYTEKTIVGKRLPIRALVGDQQAAAIGQACFSAGDIKSTYGTGCFALINTGHTVLSSSHKLLSTIAYRWDGKTTYAMEGSIFVAGAAIQWLRDELGIIASSNETTMRAQRAATDSRALMVPAFTGLGAPHWHPHARATLFGMTRATGVDDIVRATLLGIAHQSADLLAAMAADGLQIRTLRIDGGMAANEWFMEALADLCQIDVIRPKTLETTALGAAYAAGLGIGLYSSTAEISSNWQTDSHSSPKMPPADHQRSRAYWSACVKAVLAVADIVASAQQ